jgi:hypothetical protein
MFPRLRTVPEEETMPSKYTVHRQAVTDFHPSAECENPNCHWSSARSPNTLKDLKVHISRTGHSVRVAREVISLYTGNPRV